VQPWASWLLTHVSLSPSSIWYQPTGGWCLAAGKVTVGLTSHWPRVTDNSGITTYGLMALGDEHPAQTPVGVWHTLFLPFTKWGSSFRLQGQLIWQRFCKMLLNLMLRFCYYAL